MNKQVRNILVLVVLISSLSCKLVEQSRGEDQTAAQEEVTIDLSQADELREIMVDDYTLGGIYLIDMDMNGGEDSVYVEYPYQHPVEGVQLVIALAYAQVTREEYAQRYLLSFSNEQAESQLFSYTFTVPQNFAKSADDLFFDPQPDKIKAGKKGLELTYQIELAGKSTNRFNNGVMLASYPQMQITDEGRFVVIESAARFVSSQIEVAKTRAMLNAYTELKAYCAELPEPKRSSCFARLADAYQDLLDPGDPLKKELSELCNEVKDLTRRTACHAVIHKNIGKCDTNKLNKTEKQKCMAQYIETACEKLPDYEQDTYRMEMAVKHKVGLTCVIISQEDMQNDCLARVTGNANFCKNIKNPDRKKKCEEDLGKSAIKEKPSNDPNTWFNEKDAQRLCMRFQPALPGYKLEINLGRGDDLACHFKNPNLNPDDQWSGYGIIRIHAYDTREDAEEIGWIPNHSRDKREAENQSISGHDHGLIHEGERYFFYRNVPEDGKPNYHINAARLYDTVVIEYSDDSRFSDQSQSSWEQIEKTAVQIIDEKRGK